ncbi:alpha-N-acetylglucosaminidase [Nocardiopsis nanhaiensis]
MAARTRGEPDWGATVRGLARRILGRTHPPLRLSQLSHDRRSFEYRADQGVLTLGATDGVAAAVGLHTYLRRACGVMVAWDTRLPLPVTAFADAPTTHRTAEVDQSYYLNFCTQGYTAPYWDWDDWERECDWMALHGVTMPLTILGHEAVLHRAYTGLGLDDDVIRTFLGGPGYLPWQYMGNLDSFVGPLPQAWIEGHLELARRVLDRQRSFGMRPVLPGFTGHVPRVLAPDQVTPRPWQGFTTHVLDPHDALYAHVGAQITAAQQDLLGTDHLYAIDPFIEMPPVEADPAFPGAVAQATLDGLRRTDPEAVWVMQAWPFSYQSHFWTTERVTAFLGAIEDQRLLVLDLWAEHDPQWSRFDSFGGTPWVWCALLNFGGRTDPLGDLQGTTEAINKAKDTEAPPVGLGLAMEATGNNPAFFELVADQAWNRVEDVAGDWLPAFVAQRYGPGADPALLRGWRGLLATIYGASGVRIFPEQFNGIITTKPHYRDLAETERLRTEASALVWYDWPVLVRAWQDLVSAGERRPELVQGPLGRDLADVAMAVMARVADHSYLTLVQEAVSEGAHRPQSLEYFLGLFEDLDALLATRPEYRFQNWEHKATSWATSTEEHHVLADNARRIITVWDTPDSPFLHDYAGRLWSGLVGGYYRSRWQLWGQGLDQALVDPGPAGRWLDQQLTERADAFLRDGAGPVRTDAHGILDHSRALLDRYGHPAH